MEMASEILSELSVNDTVRRWPGTVEVFNRHGIDACCGGAASIREAAERDGAEAEAVLSDLLRAIGGGTA